MTGTMPPRRAAMSPEQFRALLKRHGLSQGRAAEQLGVSLRSVNRWACGKGSITAATAALIREKIHTD